jgi:hypothetical protein
VHIAIVKDLPANDPEHAAASSASYDDGTDQLMISVNDYLSQNIFVRV